MIKINSELQAIIKYHIDCGCVKIEYQLSNRTFINQDTLYCKDGCWINKKYTYCDKGNKK